MFSCSLLHVFSEILCQFRIWKFWIFYFSLLSYFMPSWFGAIFHILGPWFKEGSYIVFCSWFRFPTVCKSIITEDSTLTELFFSLQYPLINFSHSQAIGPLTNRTKQIIAKVPSDIFNSRVIILWLFCLIGFI